MDFLPLRVTHDVKYSCWKPQYIGNIERNKILVFTKVFLAEFVLSGNLQNFIHAKIFCKFLTLQNFLQYYSTNFKTGKSELIFFFFGEFLNCLTYVKTFVGVPDYICLFYNCWTLLTFFPEICQWNVNVSIGK